MSDPISDSDYILKCQLIHNRDVKEIKAHNERLVSIAANYDALLDVCTERRNIGHLDHCQNNQMDAPECDCGYDLAATVLDLINTSPPLPGSDSTPTHGA